VESSGDDVPRVPGQVDSRALGALALVLFASQFVIEDRVLSAGLPWTRARGFDAALSLALGFVALTVTVAPPRSRSRARTLLRGVVAATWAAVLVLQAMVFRYYHAPLDVQVAASALHAWHDVRGVLVRALPVAALTTALVAVAEYQLLRLAVCALPSRTAPEGRRSVHRKATAVVIAVAVAVVWAGLLRGSGPRHATPEVRAVHALDALASRHRVDRGVSHGTTPAATLPPLLTERALPDVLFVLTESVRASDYLTQGDGATAPETARVTRGRVDLRQLRAVSSYTAVSVSAILTGASQEGPRARILALPSMFDLAHAARDPAGASPTVLYFSAQSATVFEADHVRATVDRFVTVETLHGHDVEDDADYAQLPLDREIVDAFLDELPRHPAGQGRSAHRPLFAVLHLVSTHAPYFVDPARAPFRPYGHVVTWAGMPELHAAYRNAIVAQDALVARAIEAFVARAGSRPWLVVLTSDHGEAFGENGAIHHGQNLMDEQVHVPAFVAYGGGALDAAQARALADHTDRFVTHLDLLPTVLDAMGLGDNPAVAAARARAVGGGGGGAARLVPGRSLLRPHAPRPPLPVTNCTGMFPCPLDTWGLYEEDRKLVARRWDPGWSCLALTAQGEGPAERASPSDPACDRLRAASRIVFPTLPNGAPNR